MIRRKLMNLPNQKWRPVWHSKRDPCWKPQVSLIFEALEGGTTLYARSGELVFLLESFRYPRVPTVLDLSLKTVTTVLPETWIGQRSFLSLFATINRFLCFLGGKQKNKNILPPIYQVTETTKTIWERINFKTLQKQYGHNPAASHCIRSSRMAFETWIWSELFNWNWKTLQPL